MSTRLETEKTVLELESKHNFRWTVVIWLLIGGIINYLDRANLSIAAPEMMRELGLTKTDIGLPCVSASLSPGSASCFAYRAGPVRQHSLDRWHLRQHLWRIFWRRFLSGSSRDDR